MVDDFKMNKYQFGLFVLFPLGKIIELKEITRRFQKKSSRY